MHCVSLGQPLFRSCVACRWYRCCAISNPPICTSPPTQRCSVVLSGVAASQALLTHSRVQPRKETAGISSGFYSPACSDQYSLPAYRAYCTLLRPWSDTAPVVQGVRTKGRGHWRPVLQQASMGAPHPRESRPAKASQQHLASNTGT